MSYQTIVVHLDCGSRRSERLDLALRFAEEFDSHLIGLFALDLYAGMPRAADAGSILVESELQRRDVCLRQAEEEFFIRCARRAAKAEWRFADEDAVAEMAIAAGSADLVVIGQTHPETCADDGVRASFASDVVLNAGKPVMIVPYAGHFEGIGKRTMVAWNTGPQAGRALAYSLPVLERSGSVDVVSFEEGGAQLAADEEARSAVNNYLQDHGVNATIRRYVGEDLTAGELILAQAYDKNADCIIMGAYGKSRIDAADGVTRTVMKFMTVPVIMSH